MSAPEVHAHEVYPCEMHAHEVHAHKMHPREVHAHETLAHHCFGRFLAQTVVDLSRSKFENTSFCANCGLVPMTRRSRRTGCDKVARAGTDATCAEAAAAPRRSATRLEFHAHIASL
jgi:hypothetical protein